ncbi:MAG: four helix bundle protein [Candidatus Sungbacteria bacterium]|uniref:Four helix bundle protein n=1 Tax=Candidatus Sungiibacteriota bacterium TaxID=2750080 RepID=A0A9D6LRG7_9BACT|nr:four helix bundle protein [Candidatus Sungbacteria bacterium]
MSTVKQFEDLIAWQKARELTKFIYEISKSRHFEIDRGLQDQIRRAAVSVMSNIAEGFDRGTKAELINYLYIAKGSAGEVKSQLYIARDIGYIDTSEFRNGVTLADNCSRLLQSFIQRVRAGSQPGLQYKKAVRPEIDLWLESEMKKAGMDPNKFKSNL